MRFSFEKCETHAVEWWKRKTSFFVFVLKLNPTLTLTWALHFYNTNYQVYAQKQWDLVWWNGHILRERPLSMRNILITQITFCGMERIHRCYETIDANNLILRVYFTCINKKRQLRFWIDDWTKTCICLLYNALFLSKPSNRGTEYE